MHLGYQVADAARGKGAVYVGRRARVVGAAAGAGAGAGNAGHGWGVVLRWLMCWLRSFSERKLDGEVGFRIVFGFEWSIWGIT